MPVETHQYNPDQWRKIEVKLALSMQKLYEGFCLNKGLQYLIDQAGELFGRPLILYDTRQKVLAASFETEPVFSVTERSRGMLRAAVKIDAMEIAELAIFKAGMPFQEFDLLLIEKMGPLLSAQLQRNILLNLDHNQVPDSILVDLVEGKPLKDTVLNNRGRYLKWAKTEPFYIAVLCGSRRELFESIKSPVFQALKRYIPLEQIIIYESGIVAFFDQALYDVLFDKHGGTFLRFLEENDLYAGVSQRYSALTDSKKQYKNAVTALEIGMTRKLCCSFFDDSTLYILRGLVSGRYDLTDFCHPAVQQLQQYDKEHGTKYLDTLKQYLYYASAPGEAARVLNIHKNTLFYRIGKIKELTGITLDFGDEVCKLFLSMRLLELE